jgi:hypothetical protein
MEARAVITFGNNFAFARIFEESLSLSIPFVRRLSWGGLGWGFILINIDISKRGLAPNEFVKWKCPDSETPLLSRPQI